MILFIESLDIVWAHQPPQGHKRRSSRVTYFSPHPGSKRAFMQLTEQNIRNWAHPGKLGSPTPGQCTVRTTL